MSNTKLQTKIRPIAVHDLDTILTIDREIRNAHKAITYASITTADIITGETRTSSRKRSSSYYLDLISGETTGSLSLGFAAEVKGHVQGFAIGRIVSAGKPATRVGQIVIIGVHPDYQRRGIATQLTKTICDEFHSRDVALAEFEVDIHDKELLDFVERMGFNARQPIRYTKNL